MSTTRSQAELESQIEASRRALAQNIGVIGDTFSTVGARSREAGRRALRTARDNPVWLSVIGGLIVAGGAAYLVVQLLEARRRPRSLRERVGAAISARLH